MQTFRDKTPGLKYLQVLLLRVLNSLEKKKKLLLDVTALSIKFSFRKL